MDIITLQSLADQIGTANGYISAQRAGDRLELKGNNFLGKIVVWVRFKLNRNYKEAALTARDKIMLSLMSDHKYGEDFSKRINSSDPKGKIFYESKPLSARKVNRFIAEVQSDVAQRRASVEDRVSWWSGNGNTTESNESFISRTDTMLKEKLKNARDIIAADVDLLGVSDTVNKEVLADDRMMARIGGGEDCGTCVDQVLSKVLDRRIDEVRLEFQGKLMQQLEPVGLPARVKQPILAEIADTTIATLDELEARVNNEVVKQIGDEFDGLLQKQLDKYDFGEHLAQLPVVKEQLQARLAGKNQYKMLSVADAREQATQLLGQWMQGKKETLAAIKVSQYTGVDNLLKRLVLQNPYIAKPQIEAMQRDIEQALEESYSKNADAYEALGMDKGKLLSKLRQFTGQDVLFNNLRDLCRQSSSPDALFGNNDWQATGVGTAVRDYVEAVSDPTIENYKKISALEGEVPGHIYDTLIGQVAKGDVYNPEFVSTANQLHISSLTENDHQGFYSLLQSPQVAGKRIGSKADLTHFTLEDLLKKMLSDKDIKNANQRRKAIDAVIPENTRYELLNKLEHQLGMVKSRIMSGVDAEGLFQRGALQFLREQKISFEDMKIMAEAKPEVSSSYLETPL